MNPFIFRYNNFLFGTISATDTASGYDVNNIIDYRPYTYWVAASAGTKYITLDGSGNYPGDTLGIAGHNLGTASAKLTVEFYNIGTTTWEVILDEFTVTSDKPIIKKFPSSKTAYDWRLKIVTASIAPRIGVMQISGRTEFPYPPNAPLTHKQLTPLFDSYESESGYLLGVNHKFTRLQLSHSWSNLSATFIDSTYLPMWEAHLAKGYPFFYAVDLDNAPNEVYYVRIADGDVYAPDKSIKDYYNTLNLNMVGVYE